MACSRNRVCVLALSVCLLGIASPAWSASDDEPQVVAAPDATAGADHPAAQRVVSAATDPAARDASPLTEPRAGEAGAESLARGSRPLMPGLPLAAVGRDFVRFASPGTVSALAPFGLAAMAVAPWDGRAAAEAHEHLPASAFEPGSLGGNFLVHAGASAAMWAAGRATGRPGLAWLGSDILRAQLLSQGIVQGLKFATQRPRPDRSNRQSFPSGHTSTAFATASVLHQHYGWKAAIPAYAFGAYVGASRMSHHRHHVSDVLLGAAIGTMAGRTVTVGLGGRRFSVGVAPAPGGAAMTFTAVPGR